MDEKHSFGIDDAVNPALNSAMNVNCKEDSPLSFARLIQNVAIQNPDQNALVSYNTNSQGKKNPAQNNPSKSKYEYLTFKQLHEQAERIAAGLVSLGVKRGHRVLVLLTPDQEFVAFNLALNRILAVPVLIDLGMGIQRMLNCIRDCAAEVMAGIPKAYWLRRLFPSYFSSIETSIISKKSWVWRNAQTIESLSTSKADIDAIKEPEDSEIATIVFTSGSTGIAKGVELTHRQISTRRQVRDKSFDLSNANIELSTFPAFLLMSIASGRTCVLAGVNLAKPGRANPRKIVEAICDQRANHFFGSPALLNRLTSYCLEGNISLPSIAHIVTGGAPIPFHVIERFRMISPNAKVVVGYGATEALPVSYITLDEISRETQELSRRGKGHCVGTPVPETEVKIIQNRNGEIESWNGLQVPKGEIGEIVVRGECVTNQYFGKPANTRASSIKCSDGTENIWHRMGDLGYLDEKGRIWVCGRKSHLVRWRDRDYYPVQIEGVLNGLTCVQRTALVGVVQDGETKPAIVYEPSKTVRLDERQTSAEIQEVLATNGFSIEYIFPYLGSFPVDQRHNSKIERLQLAKWAQRRLKNRFFWRLFKANH